MREIRKDKNLRNKNLRSFIHMKKAFFTLGETEYMCVTTALLG